MEIYLANTACQKFMFAEGTPGNVALHHYKPNLLQSFGYLDKNADYVRQVAPANFMLDSGAFSYMNGKASSSIDWDVYINEYADYINQNNIDLFYELDIDSIVGYDKVLEIRKKIETLTGKKPIPVWHKSRKVTEFKKMCDEYDYVAIGGFVTQEIKKPEYEKVATLISHAHNKGCKIHGLGFTSTQWLPKLHFDSVDSTAWQSGIRYCGCYRFDGVNMTKVKLPDNVRIKDYKPLAVHDFIEWCKFTEYARKYL